VVTNDRRNLRCCYAAITLAVSRADVRAAIDHNGKIAAYEYHGWQHG
jgi:hypothetical protein